MNAITLAVLRNRKIFLMKKIILSGLCSLLIFAQAYAQSPVPAVNHSHDFLVVQLSYDMWPGAPDSVQTGGFSRGLNIAFMWDFPFNSGSHFSVAPGLGISSSNIFFKHQTAAIGSLAPTLNFDRDTVYKHFKLATAYVEIPIELRYRQFSDNANKGLKAGVGLKFGALLNAHTKGKKAMAGVKQVDKISNKRYFERWRVAGTVRVGYGNFAVFANYSFTPLLKQNAGPEINPLQVGLCVSGL
jgi:hypothetical protein